MESSKDEYLPREIKLLVIHCSATRCNVSFPVERHRECHLQRGLRDIGYHFYITRDGVLHHCRPVSEIGAHVRGFNRHSIGICYEGGLDENGKPADTRPDRQKHAMTVLVRVLVKEFPIRRIVGHRDLSPDLDGDGTVEPEEWIKQCPCFEVGDCLQEWIGRLNGHNGDAGLKG